MVGKGGVSSIGVHVVVTNGVAKVLRHKITIRVKEKKGQNTALHPST